VKDVYGTHQRLDCMEAFQGSFILGLFTFGTYNKKGTGLGLLLCKGYIEADEGKILIGSELNKVISVFLRSTIRFKLD
jgi:hypothetical protein